MCLISTPSSSLTHLCFRKWSHSQALTVGPSLLSEQEISYKSWPLAPGCCPPCEKIRNYNSILSQLSILPPVQSSPALQHWMFCFQGGTVGQLDSWNTFHVNINWRFSAPECLSVSAELSVIGTNLYLQLTDWMWTWCQEEINTYYSPEIFRGIRILERIENNQIRTSLSSFQLDEVTFTVLCLSDRREIKILK